MPRFTLALVLLLFAVPFAHADATINVACGRPTTWDDGTPLPADTPMAFKFFGALKDQPKVQLNATAVLNACTYDWVVPTSGIWCVEASAIADAQESDHGPEACMTLSIPAAKPAIPGAPTLTLVTKSTVAYTIISAGKDRLAAIIVGTAPLGTVCDARQPVLNFHVIPRAAVTFTGTLKPDTIAAYCGG